MHLYIQITFKKLSLPIAFTTLHVWCANCNIRRLSITFTFFVLKSCWCMEFGYTRRGWSNSDNPMVFPCFFSVRITGPCRNKMSHTKSSLSPINLTCWRLTPIPYVVRSLLLLLLKSLHNAFNFTTCGSSDLCTIHIYAEICIPCKGD